MPQVPATPKVRRLKHLLTAALRGPTHIAPEGLHPSEIEALNARVERPVAAGPDRPHVTFIIPLVGRHHVQDWAGVERRLAATLDSFYRQTRADWRAVVCGQHRPQGIDWSGKVRFLPFTEQIDGNDKWAKLAALSRALPEHAPADGYVMPFDADDLLGPDVVEQMVARRAPGGYLITQGLVMNAQTGLIGRARPQSLLHPGQKAFWKLCGSAAAFRCDMRDAPEADPALIGAITSHEHRMFPYLARLAGRPLKPVWGDAALYILNHGDNFGARRGRTGYKHRFVERFGLSDSEAETARATFALTA